MRILSFDGESNGLHGPVFAIGGVLYDRGREIDRFYARCPIVGEVNSWVQVHVLPMLPATITHATAREMRDAFWAWFKSHEGVMIVGDHAWPVEAGLLIDCINDDRSREWHGPNPMHEVATLMYAAGFDGNRCYGGVVLPDEPDCTHNPVYDARVSALCAEMALRRLGRIS